MESENIGECIDDLIYKAERDTDIENKCYGHQGRQRREWEELGDSYIHYYV